MRNKKANRTILIAVAGLTPQIITETLYSLIIKKSLTLQEIHVLTTTEGKKKIDRLLLDNGEGAFYRFCRHYGEQHGFRAEDFIPQVHVIKDKIGKELDDIRTLEDNEIAANFIVQFVRRQAKRQDISIHASMAGGRKTMSAFLEVGMQFYGRRQDRVSHVLVQPSEIENNPGFFYPLPPGEKIMTFQDKSGKSFSIPIANIKIDLAEIPFVKLREILPEDFQEEILEYTDMVARAEGLLHQAQFAPALIIDLGKRLLTVKAKNETFKIPLSPREIVLYWYLGENRQLINDVDNNKTVAPELLIQYRKITGDKEKTERFFQPEDIREIRSRINQKLRNKIPYRSILSFLTIQSNPPRSNPCYVLPLPLDYVQIIAS